MDHSGNRIVLSNSFLWWILDGEKIGSKYQWTISPLTQACIAVTSVVSKILKYLNICITYV